MRLKTLFISGVLLTILLFLMLAGGATVFWNYYNQAMRGEQFARQTTTAVQQLSVLTSEYLLRSNDRAKFQWNKRHASLEKLLATDGAEKARFDLEVLQRENRKLRTIFEGVVAAHAAHPASASHSYLEKIRADQMHATMQTMASHADRIGKIYHAEMYRVGAQVRWLLAGTVAVVFIWLILLWLVIAKRVIRPLEALTQEVPRLAESLDYRLSSQGNDEIGSLSRAFNNLAERLQKTLVSKDALSQEILIRQRSEEKLRLNEVKLMEAQALARVGNWELNILDNTLFWSEEVFRIFEVDPTKFDASYETFINAVHPDDREMVDKAYTDSLAKKTPYNIIHRLQFAGGRIKYVNERCNTFYDEHGQPFRSVGTVQDISDRHEAQLALAASEEKLQSILDNTTAVIYLKDCAGNYQLINRRYEQIFNVTQQEIVGKRDEDIFPKEIADKFRENDLAVIEGRVPLEIDEQAIHKDGLHDYISIKFPLINAQGEVYAVGGISTDITERKQAEEQLSLANAEWTQAMDQFSEPIYLLDMQRRLLRANGAFYQMVGLPSEQCVGRHITELIHPEGEEFPCPMCMAQESGKEVVLTFEADDQYNPTGKPIEASLNLVRNKLGEPTSMLMSIHDLSRAREIEERLRLSASVFENTDEGVVITDTEANIIDVNRAFGDITGYAREEVIGKNPRIYKSRRQDASFYRDMWKALVDVGSWRGELWNRHKNGSLFPVWQSISSVTDSNGKLTHYIGVFSDISHIKDSQAKLNHLAHHDALTDLPNRLLLKERLEQAIWHADRHGAQLAVIFLDLDQFKHINDSMGHLAGDQLLEQVAARLTDTVRQADTIARIGGDEFVLLLEDMARFENARISAEKCMLAFEEPFILEGQEIHITVSLGISIYPRDGQEASVLLRNADSAMYRAKEAGRNNYQFYTEDLTKNALERVLLESNLRKAVDENEFRLHYQPQVNIDQRTLVGVEALVRWSHPQLGLIPPSRFIPIAEESGVINIIGEWVLRTACRVGRGWIEQGFDFGKIAVNVAGPQIQRGGLVNVVKSVLEETRFPPERLELEITEGFIMQQADTAIAQLEALRELGITLAIDDFGTGYSSLSYLKQLPIHKLKIDQSFVRDIPDDPNDMAIADAIIAMGKSLGLSVIAEGVEKEEQALFLRDAGCQEAQGYLYSKPVNSEELEQLMEKPGL